MIEQPLAAQAAEHMELKMDKLADSAERRAWQRRQQFLTNIDPLKMIGLEVGALNRPTVTHDMGQIYYADFTTTAHLQKLYENVPSVDPGEIVDVDYIWANDTQLPDLIGEKKFDYILASHVIEHIPNPVSWFKQLSCCLRAGGIVSLIAPDKRFTFDRLRPLSSLPELVGAYLEGRTRPTSSQIFSHVGYHSTIDLERAWQHPEEEIPVARVHNERDGLQIAAVVEQAQQYYDAHCWVFTPRVFLDLLSGLTDLNLLDFEIASFNDTHTGEIDFFVSLRKLDEDLSSEERLARSVASIEAAKKTIRVGAL